MRGPIKSFQLNKKVNIELKEFKNLEFIDFGSGFKVPYKKGDLETNIEELGKKLSSRFTTPRWTRS